MLYPIENLQFKMRKTILTIIPLGLFLLSLVSCNITQPSPPVIERPTIESEPSPTPTETEDEDDGENEQDDAAQDEKNDPDKDKNN